MEPASQDGDRIEQAVHASNYLFDYHPFGIGDFDGDGIDEMLARHLPTGRLYLVGYDGFTDQRIETLLGNAGPLPATPSDRGVVVGDVDGDGRDEVHMYGPSGVRRGELDLKTWDLSWDTLGGSGAIFPADWTGDGALDFLALDGGAWKLGTWTGTTMNWASRGGESKPLTTTGFRHWQILIKGKPRILAYRDSDTRLFVGTLGTAMTWQDMGVTPERLGGRSVTEGSDFAISWGDYRDHSSGTFGLWSADVWKFGASAQTVDFNGDDTTEILFIMSVRKNDELAQSHWVAWSFNESGGVVTLDKWHETWISTDKDDQIEKYFFFETGAYKINHKFFRGRFVDNKAESILEHEYFPTSGDPLPTGRAFLWRLQVSGDGKRRIVRLPEPSVSLAGSRVYAANIQFGGFMGKQALFNGDRYEWGPEGYVGFTRLTDGITSGDYDTSTAHERAGSAQNSSPVPIENQFGFVTLYQRRSDNSLMRFVPPASWNTVPGAAGTAILSKPAGVYYDYRDRLFALAAGGHIVAIDGGSSPQPAQLIEGPPPGAASAPAVRLFGTPYWQGPSTSFGLELYVRGSDNQIWRKALLWCTTCGGSFWDVSRDWEAIGGSITRDPAVAQLPDGSIHVFARGPTGSLVHGSSGGSSPFVWKDTPLGLGSSPVALVTPGGGDLNVFYARELDDVVCSARITTDGSLIRKCFWGDVRAKSDPGVLYFGRDPDASGNPLFYRVGIWTTTPASPNHVFARDDFQVGTLELSVPHFGWYVRQLVRLSQLTPPPPIPEGFTEAHYWIGVGEGDTSSSSNAATPSCAASNAPELGYRFRLAQPSRVTASTLGSNYDTVLYLVPAGQPAQQLACNDDAPGSRGSSIDVTLPAGEYDVIVDGYGTSVGRATLELVTERLPSTNDTAATAAWLAPTNRGNTHDLRDDYAGACGGGGSLDATHTFTLASEALVALSAGGTPFDTVLSIRSAADIEFVCNGDGDTGASFIEAVMQPGTYTVVLDGASAADAGRYLLTSELGAVPGDTPSDPRTLWRDGTFAGHTYGLAADLAGSCAPSVGSDAVFAFSLEEPAHVFLDTRHSHYDTVLHVRRASDLTEIACNDDTNGTFQSGLEVDLAAGDYYVVVGGYAGQTGAFSLQVSRDTPR